MAKIDKNNLGYLGYDYQLRLIAQILTDRKFANSIIDIVDPNYFEDPYLRVVAATIKDAKITDDIIPDIGSLEFRLLEDVKDDTQRKYAISQLRKIQEANLHDTLKVQDIAMKFCKQQELKKSVNEITKIINKGDIEDYDKCEAILRKALEHGDNKDDGVNVFDNLDIVLADDYRKPIRTGINGLDDVMDGGLSKGELGLFIAAMGVGKTTMATKLANTAVSDGKKVLHLFFEDTIKVIQRKHLSCWSKIDLNSLSIRRDEVIKIANDMVISSKESKGYLTLVKLTYGTTIPMIKKRVMKLIAEGNKPDLIVLDYIDCVETSRRFDDVNVGEGSIMREFEALLSDLDIAGWCFSQGNRASIKAEVVEADQMGGSIKKGQIAHFVGSIAKTLDQRDNNTATIAILKSRFGKSGVIFSDVIFDNGKVQIDMGNNQIGKTHIEFKQDVNSNNQDRVNSVLSAAKNRQSVLSGITVPNAE